MKPARLSVVVVSVQHCIAVAEKLGCLSAYIEQLNKSKAETNLTKLLPPKTEILQGLNLGSLERGLLTERSNLLSHMSLDPNQQRV